MHFNLCDPITLARLTAATAHIETEATWLITARAGFLGACKELSDRGENARIGRRVLAGCATDRRLVNVDALVEVIEALAVGMCRSAQGGGPIQCRRREWIESTVNKS